MGNVGMYFRYQIQEIEGFVYITIRRLDRNSEDIATGRILVRGVGSVYFCLIYEALEIGTLGTVTRAWGAHRRGCGRASRLGGGDRTGSQVISQGKRYDPRNYDTYYRLHYITD